MNIRLRAQCALVGLFLSLCTAGIAAAADRPYTEGSVLDITSVRTEPGMFDDYMAWLASTYKKEMEALKAAGIVVDYAIYQATPRGPDDPDVYLVVSYKNMAALDGLNARTDPIYESIEGSMAEQNKAYIARGKMRRILGDQYIRELKLK